MSGGASLCERLEAQGLTVRRGVMGRAVTTFAVGGAMVLAEFDCAAQAAAAQRVWDGSPVRVLGAGSNLVIDDAGVPGVVLKAGRGLRYVKPLGEGRFEAGAALPLMSLARRMCDAGWSGLEFAGGIPGSVGGALRMNAGAYGRQTADLLIAVTAAVDGEIVRFRREEIEFGYRRSGLPAEAAVVSAEFQLTPGDRSLINRRRAELLAQRKARQPLGYASAGSVFKNPPHGLSAGALIEQTGLKGALIGGARVSEKHANWIINPDKNASSRDIRALVDLIRARVCERWGVELECEIIFWP